jgi:hypothetical protein
MPSVTNHRPGTINDYRRMFNLVSTSSIKRGTSDGNGEAAALSISYEKGAPSIYGCLF